MIYTRLLSLLMFICLIQGLHAQSFKGFFDFEYQDSTGKLLLKVDKLNQEFLMVNAYGTGLGS
ncbi:MAG: hypothetical protein WBO36_00355, partial [Saprospiraceae bacterium]